MLIRRMKSSPICMFMDLRGRAMVPVVAIWVGMSWQVVMVSSTRDSKREV
jgi:hypothetical protein